MSTVILNALVATSVRGKKEVQFVLSVEGVPLVTTWHMDPASARGFAALLLDAADTCEQVVEVPTPNKMPPRPA